MYIAEDAIKESVDVAEEGIKARSPRGTTLEPWHDDASVDWGAETLAGWLG